MSKSLFIFFAVLWLPSIMVADQVVFKNGDRLSGSIVKSDNKSLVMKTEFSGEVTIDWSAITDITSTQTLHINMKNGQSSVGTVTTQEGNLIVATAANGPVTVSRENVVDLEQESTYEHLHHPGLTEGWAGGINAGFALTAGNSETKNFALAFTADRKSAKDHLGLYANSVYATSSSPGAVSGTTANSIQSGLRYDRDFAKRLFGFVNGDFQTDALQGLNLRSVLGGGLGYHFVKNDRTTLDLLAGLNYTRENYTTLQRNIAALTLGEEFTHQWRKSTLITEKLYFFPDLNQSSEYRSTFALGTVTKISKWLGWQNAFGDIYVTNPPAGKKKNDITLTTGLNIAFAH